MKVARARGFQRIGSDRYNYPALNDLDRKMIALLPDAGVFLEIGANDGYIQSNTYHLETWRGWRGILIEPVPRLFDFCQRIRPRAQCFNVACVADPATTEVELDDTDLTTMTIGEADGADDRPSSGRRVVAKALTLSAVIDQSTFDSIDFMSIDVEGAEMAVLGGLDLDRHLPSYLLVETKHPERIDELLGDRMARMDQLSHHDYLWRHS